MLKTHKISLHFCLFFLLALALDQFLKFYALANFAQEVYFLPWVKFTLAYNYQIAWSLPLPSFLIIPVSLTLLFAIIVFYFFKISKTFLATILFAILTAGAAGNLLDRFLHGAVIDFISIGSFPIFNLADSYITISVFLIFFFYDKIMGKIKTKKDVQSTRSERI
jgi:signal peptidase II